MSQHYLATTDVPDTDCLLYLGVIKRRDPQGTNCQVEGPRGCHPLVSKISGQEMISICLYQQSLRDKAINMEITDKDMLSKSK